MKTKILFVLFLFPILTSCASVQVPKYVQDKNSYKHKFYSEFNEVLEVTKSAIEDSGWRISDTSDPDVFERESSAAKQNGPSILIFTQIKEIPMFIGTRYARMNVYLRSGANNTTDAEFRYVTMNSFLFFTFKNYSHAIAIDHLINKIEENLK